MASTCKKCGAPIVARFAELTGGLCTMCAHRATTPGQEIPANVKRIATTLGTTRAKPQAESSEHDGNGRDSLRGPTEQAAHAATSSYHCEEVAQAETVSESYTESIGLRVTPSMMEQLRNTAQLKLSSVPDLIRQAIQELLASES